MILRLLFSHIICFWFIADQINARESFENVTPLRTRLRSSTKNQTNIKPESSGRVMQLEEELQSGDRRVPFWNIAHMINSIEEIPIALAAGANGIEVDVSFDKRGHPVESYHGFPCDCGRHCHFRNNFIEMIDYIAGITTKSDEKNRLLIVLFDLKLKDLDANQKPVAGRQLAKILYEHLYLKYKEYSKRQRDDQVQPPVRVVVSINHVTDLDVAKSFISYLRENNLDFMSQQVGFDVGMNDNLNDILNMWNELQGATFNIWQGDGLTNCANLVRGVDRLKEAVSIRNAQGHFRKIYYWTADVMYQIRAVLRLGLDAILTNQPMRVRQVLEEPEFKAKYRMALAYDYPFAQFWIQPSAWKMSPPTLGETVETVSNIQKTSADFVKTIPDGVVAVLKKVQHKITSIT